MIKSNALFFVILFLSLAIIPGFLIADQLPVKSSGELEFYFDTASFQSSLGNVYQEFYYQIPLEQLGFHEDQGQMVDSLQISVHLINESGKTVYQDTKIIPVVADMNQEISGRFLPDQFDLLCDPGTYQATLKIEELASHVQGKAWIKFTAPDFSKKQFSLSSVQFASEAQRDSTQSKFTKNGIRLLPNPARVYGNSLPMLIFYYEIYQKTNSNTSRDTFLVEYKILNSHNDVVRSLPEKLKKSQGQTSVEIGAISTAGLPDSTYKLLVKVTDQKSGQELSSKNSFANIALTTLPKKLSLIARIIKNLTPQELNLHIRQTKYIMTKTEYDLLKQMDETGKRNYMIQFWDSRDPDLNTPENEFWLNYRTRIQVANSRFTTGYEKGWLTDRGRIMIKYGIPDEIERHPLSQDSKPFEVWSYYRNKGLKFIFIDEEGFNQYRLIYT
ncbi:MAG: GWxTD domain-containing protein, partial [Calditrichaeota bacterium]|nr:GWxTD domain-containing protein [Calditrichota bacterium]